MPFWSELTQVNFSKISQNTRVAVMITGATEAHGTHLPLGTDMILPSYLGNHIAEKTNAIVLPAIPFGDSWTFIPFRGTIAISPITLTKFYVDVMESVFRQGFRFLIALNGHGGNEGSLRQAASIATSSDERAVIVVNWWKDLAAKTRKEVLETPDGHAAEDETSEVLFVRPDLVDVSNVVSARVETKYRIISGVYREELMPSAIYGNPKAANEEKGKAIIEDAINELIELIEQLEKGELPIVRD